MIRDESGTGLTSSIVGVTVFLVLLLFAVQLVLNLYATSVVTAVTFDAARIVAGADGGPEAEAQAEAHVREMLDGYGPGSLTLTWAYEDRDAEPGDDSVTLTVDARHPTRLLSLVPLPYQAIHRTVTVRLERFR